MDTTIYPFVSTVVAGMLSLQTLGMLWAAHETHRRYPAMQYSWTRLFLILCWPVCLLLMVLTRRP